MVNLFNRRARKMIGKNMDGCQSQRAVTEQLLKHQRLTNKIQGNNDGSSSDENDLNAEESRIDGLKQLKNLDGVVDHEKSTLFNMAFMRKGEERKKLETKLIMEDAIN
jgi:U3 small nucleolar RNA-associated protein 14